MKAKNLQILKKVGHQRSKGVCERMQCNRCNLILDVMHVVMMMMMMMMMTRTINDDYFIAIIVMFFMFLLLWFLLLLLSL